MRKASVALLLLLAAQTFAQPAPQPADLERSLVMMARVGSAGTPRFSPDSSRVALITNLSGSPQVWVVNAAGGWPEQVTALEDPVSGLEWSPDGKWMAIEVAPGGGLNQQIHLLRPDGSELRRVTDGGRENNRLQLWTPDSKSVLMVSNRKNPASMDLYAIDAASGATRLIAESPGLAFIADVSADSRYAIVGRLRNRGDNDMYRVALDGSGEIHLTRHQPPATFGAAEFGKTADVVYMSGNPDRDRNAFGRVRVENGVAGPFEVLLDRPDAELDSFRMNKTKTTAMLSWNAAGRSEIVGVDLQEMKPWPGPRLPSDIAGGLQFAPDSKSLAMTLAGSRAPSDIWIYDMSKAALRQLTFSPHAGVKLSTLVRPELVSYKADDGIELTGWLYRNQNQRPPYPTVFSFHGGPEGQERPSFNSTYQALVASGMAVFAPNVRGSSGFGKKFVNLDNGALRTGSVRDIKASTDHLVRSGIADPKRMGIIGGSYGGYMVMAALTEYPDLFAAGVNMFGIVNFETFFKHSEPWMGAISKIEYGDPVTEAAMLRSLSPIHKLDRIRTPLMVMHGANDTNVPVIEAEQIVDAMKKRNVPVEYVLFADEGHGWRKTPNRIRSTVSIVKFFRENLK